MSKKVITISREFGSGGRTIAKTVAERLGYAYYDQALVSKIAEQSGYSEEFIKERGEDATSTSSFLFNYARTAGHGEINVAASDRIYMLTAGIIKSLPAEGPCVIVGRCSDYILANRSDALHVFIYADMEFKKARILEKYGETAEHIERRIESKSKRRRVYYETYTGRNWGKSEYFDICLNSGRLGIDRCIDIIAEAARSQD